MDWHGSFRRHGTRALHGPAFPPEYCGLRGAGVRTRQGIWCTSMDWRHMAVASSRTTDLTSSPAPTLGPRRWRQVGPDRAVWILDWYNYVVQHNPTPHGFETGPGNAYETPLRDRIHGRVYRVVSSQGAKRESPRLDRDDTAGLLAALASDNMFWRLQAQRLLVERGRADVVAPLVSLATSAEQTPAALHAIWTLAGLRNAGRSRRSKSLRSARSLGIKRKRSGGPSPSA